MWKKDKAALNAINQQAKDLLVKVSRSATFLHLIDGATFQFCISCHSSDAAGEFRGFDFDRSRPRGHTLPQRRWEEGLETALLCAQGFGHLLCAQRKNKGIANQSFYLYCCLKENRFSNLSEQNHFYSLHQASCFLLLGFRWSWSQWGLSQSWTAVNI